MSLEDVVKCFTPVPPPKALVTCKVRAPFIAVPYPTYLYLYIDELYYSVPKRKFQYSCSQEWCNVEVQFCLEVPNKRRLLFRYGYQEPVYHADVPMREAPVLEAYADPVILFKTSIEREE
ncbi:MAG: hypothetical protein LZ173_02045 [Thaumarchaeota archaeon]|jgi:hypothetical protein|nr:hypothetical protein [Candidatus Geocrenenecus arthurdayi]